MIMNFYLIVWKSKKNNNNNNNNNLNSTIVNKTKRTLFLFRTIEVDKFTSNLFQLYETVRSEGFTQVSF